MALRTILPLLAIVPFLAVLVWFGIARGLRPLDRLAAAVGQRSPRTLSRCPSPACRAKCSRWCTR